MNAPENNTTAEELPGAAPTTEEPVASATSAETHVEPAGSKKDRRIKAKPAAAAEKAADALTGLAGVIGAEIPGAGRRVPRLDVGVPISVLSRQMGMHLRSEPLFVESVRGDVVTVDPASGELKPMTSLRLPSWVEDRVVCIRKGKDGEEAIVSITAETASKVLASDQFKGLLRPLRGVNGVRMPAWKGAEKKELRLLEPGYDEETGVFTVNGVPVDENMDPDAVREFFMSFFGEFPFAKNEGEEKEPLERNRSFAVLMAALFAVFCRMLLRGCLRPGIAIQAAASGSGKTLLLKSTLAACYGPPAIQAMPREESEMGKFLTSVVAEGRAYLALDNVCGRLQSPELESFLTTLRRCGRVLGRTEFIEAENAVLLLMTGNGLELSPDLARRFLVVDLWYEGEVSERTIGNPINESELYGQEMRGRFLSALWALVRAWGDRGCPRSTGAVLAGFEEFSHIIGGVVQHSLFADPIKKPPLSLDPLQAAWKTIFRALADPISDGGSAEYGLDEILQTTEDAGLTEVLLGAAKSPRVSMGKKLSPFRGRQFKDSKGRRFEFSRRDAQMCTKYVVRILTMPPPEAE